MVKSVRSKMADPMTGGKGVSQLSGKPAGRMKRLTLDIPEILHREIKKNAAHEGVTMVEKLRALLLKHYGFKGDMAPE
jgi:hypothetical protein